MSLLEDSDKSVVHVYTSEQKLAYFGYGEWVEEPDNVRFIHEGLECIILRVVGNEWDGQLFGGHFCGYVKIPESWCASSLFDKETEEFDVHGGITFRGQLQNETGYLLGFDCAHFMDVVPSTGKILPGISITYGILRPSYKNLIYVEGECRKLANQVNAKINSLKNI